jgi:hypothetical protein
MARKTKDAPGRVTPKGGAGTPARPSTPSGRVTPRPVPTSGRYTAPIPDEYRSSPWWVPALILTFFGIGVIGIVLDYLGLLPAAPNNWYLLGGLGCIIAGFVAATRYH